MRLAIKNIYRQMTSIISVYALLIPLFSFQVQAKEMVTIQSEHSVENTKVINNFFIKLANFQKSVYGFQQESDSSTNKAIFEQIQDRYQQLEIDDENQVHFDSFNLKKVFSDVKKLQRELQTLLNNQEFNDQERSLLVIGGFSYIDLPIYELLSIWKSSDKLAHRYQLVRQYRTKFSYKFLTEDLKQNIDALKFKLIENSDDTFSLQLDPFARLAKELQVASQIPSVHSYLKSARLMALQMMLQQQSLYQSYIGKESEVELPSSCRNISYTQLPESYSFNLPKKEIREQMIYNMLATNGFVAGTDAYRDYYLNHSNPTTNSGFVTQPLAFQKYRYAELGIKNPELTSIDDLSTFNNFISLRHAKIQALFSRMLKRSRPKACGGRNCHDRVSEVSINKVQDIVADMLKFDNEPWILKDGNYPALDRTIDTAGLNKYIIDQMKKKNVLSWRQIAPKSFLQSLKYEDIIVDYPKNGAHLGWKIWALKIIKEAFNRINKEQKRLAIFTACNQNRQSRPCKRSNRNYIDFAASEKRIIRELDFITGTNEYVPEDLNNNKKIEDNDRLYHQIWKSLKAQKLINTRLNQLAVIENQFNSYNKWAPLYVSYKHALKYLNLTRAEKYLFKKIGDIFNLNKTFSPFHLDRTLNKSEKVSVWQSILNDANDLNGYLFNQELALHKGKTYYEKLNEIASSNLFNKSSVLSSITSLDRQADIVPMYQKMKDIFASPDFEKMMYLEDLRKSSNDFDRQQQIAEILVSIDNQSANNSDSEWASFYEPSTDDIKDLYIEMDNKIKLPLYTYIVQDAATLRIRQLKDKMQYLCELDEDDVDGIKDLYYTTAKAQMEINKQFGIQANEKVTEYLSKYNSSEKKSLWFGLGSAAIFIGSTVLGAGCSIVTGGLCMPLTAAVLAGLATGAQVYVANVEFQESYHANHRADVIREFEQLGLTDHGNAEQVSRSYMWGVMEVVFTIPMIGHLGRGIDIGHRVVQAKLKGAFKGASVLQKKLIYKTITEEVQVKYAKHILGFRSLSMEMKSALGVLSKKSKTSSLIKRAFTPEKVILTQTPKEVDEAFAQSVMTFFSNSPKKFHSFISKYAINEVDYAKQALKKLSIYERPEQLSKLRRLWGKGLPRMKIDRLNKFLQREKTLNSIMTEIKSIKSESELTEYITKNADIFNDIFEALPFQKKELPHMFFGLGGPVIRSRIPLYSKLTEVTIMKRIASARSLLKKEALRESARHSLGLSKGVKYHQTYELFKSFQTSVSEMITNGDIKIANQYKRLNQKIFSNVYSHLKKKGLKIDQTSLKRILFSPQNLTDEVQAEQLWNSIPSDELFKISNDKKLMNHIVRQLGQYKDLNGFQNYVHALKLLSITNTPELANIM